MDLSLILPLLFFSWLAQIKANIAWFLDDPYTPLITLPHKRVGDEGPFKSFLYLAKGMPKIITVVNPLLGKNRRYKRNVRKYELENIV